MSENEHPIGTDKDTEITYLREKVKDQQEQITLLQAQVQELKRR